MVEPGEYRETSALESRVRLVSRVPRGAIIRLPATASEGGSGGRGRLKSSDAEFAGFRIVGDAATPLGIGMLVANSDAVDRRRRNHRRGTSVAIDFGDRVARQRSSASDIHDNPGAALAIRPAASPRIAHNMFARNGRPSACRRPCIVETQAPPQFSGNVFHGVGIDTLRRLDDGSAPRLARDNWFP